MDLINNNLLSTELEKSLTDFNNFVIELGTKYQRVSNVDVEISSATPHRAFANEADTSELDKEIKRISNEMDRVCSKRNENLSEEEHEKISATIQRLEIELSGVHKKKIALLETTVATLGEYIRLNPNDTPKIVLYINNIKASKGNINWLLVQVYAHEMMHAYFDSDTTKPKNYTSFVEEPITELGMLNLMKEYDAKVPGIFDDALKNVKNKQQTVGCMHYGFGAYLYENELPVKYWIGIMHDGKYKTLDSTLLDQYKKPFAQGKYPTNEQQHADWLEELLDKHAEKKTVADCDSAISEYEEEEKPIPPALTRRRKRCEEKEKRGGGQTISSANGPISIYDYMKTHTPYSPELQKCIESTVQHLFNPSDKSEDTSIPGLLLGRIQSGKTRAFIGVMSLAFDKGIDACIVLTKADNGLVEQTKKRLEYEFGHFADETNIYPQNIVAIYDVNQHTALSALQLQYKNIFVLHKNQRLDKMKKILNSSFVGKKVLIIDDEADFVSRTFYATRRGVTAGVTGFRIDELSNNPEIDCYYLQVTATPYSLILQPNDVIEVSNGVMSCFRPRFTVLVPKHDRYIGGKEYFEESIDPKSMYSYLFHPISDECFNYMLAVNSDARITSNPESHIIFEGLREALMSYFVASAIRQIQELKSASQNYKSSMLIHCATLKGEHTHEQKLVNKIIVAWNEAYLTGKTSCIQPLIDKAYDDLVLSMTAGQCNGELPSVYIPSKTEVQKTLEKIFKNTEYTVKCVNGDTTDDPNMYTNSGQLKQSNLLNIFISGFKADRGITIDNMISFMYGRRPQNGGAANTILQHMRQYGNRSKEDMAVTRFHTTLALHQQLTNIYYTDESLRDFFTNNEAPKIISIDYDSSRGYRLCNPAQVRMSDMYGFKPFGRIIATGGMQTMAGIASEISKLTSEILAIEPTPKTPFKVTKLQASEWIRRIRETFEYNKSKWENDGIEWDEEIMIGAIEKYCPADGDIWCYYKPNQNRQRKDPSGFADDPEDGTTDTPTAKKYATDRPFLMLIGENGEKAKGWRDQPFIWPVLRLPISASNCVFCHGVKNANTRTFSNLKVTFGDGSIICESKIINTMIECVKKIGPENIEKLGIIYRKNNLIYSAGRKPKDYETIVSGQYYLRKGIGADKAKELLSEISDKLGLALNIEVI